MSKREWTLMLVLPWLLVACGKTQVKIQNSTGSALSEVRVSVYGSSSSSTISFANIASGATTEAQEWSGESLTVAADVSGYGEETDSVTLDSKKTNLLTLTLSGGQIVYTRSAE